VGVKYESVVIQVSRSCELKIGLLTELCPNKGEGTIRITANTGIQIIFELICCNFCKFDSEHVASPQNAARGFVAW